jgi:hypothetical protein
MTRHRGITEGWVGPAEESAITRRGQVRSGCSSFARSPSGTHSHSLGVVIRMMVNHVWLPSCTGSDGCSSELQPKIDVRRFTHHVIKKACTKEQTTGPICLQKETQLSVWSYGDGDGSIAERIFGCKKKEARGFSAIFG